MTNEKSEMLRCDRLGGQNCNCFGRVRTWVFDLDNTLYPSSCDLFAQIDVKMTGYVGNLLGLPREDARKLQKQLYHKHGTTLAGLMSEYQIDPKHFMDEVHDIDYSPVPPSPALVSALAKLPGRRVVFTNGSRDHAGRVLDRLGATHLFPEVFDIYDAAFVPKPREASFEKFFAAHTIDGGTAAMFEDLPQNLEPAHKRGMATVLIHSHLDDHPIYREIRSWGDAPPPHIHHRTDDLSGFLAGLVS